MRINTLLFVCLFISAGAVTAAPAITSINPSQINAGLFFAVVNGSGFTAAATATLGGAPLQLAYISPNQLYVEGTATVGNPQLIVTSSGASRPFPVTVNSSLVNPYAAVRFLEQASWGPTAQTIARVQQVGFQQYLQEQFAAPVSQIFDAPSDSATVPAVQANFFYNAMNGADQLRQRVAFALSEIWVISGKKEDQAKAFVPYLRILQSDAFANYSRLMSDLSLNPAMGFYLNMVNNSKAMPAVDMAPNENYARELMQLFTIGDKLLNSDGTPQLDGSGRTKPAYAQAMVADTARALTGWTYAPAPGQPPDWRAPTNYAVPMVAIEDYHDTGSKTVLNNYYIPAGKAAAQDLQLVLQNIFNHANVGPFVCRQLIQHLVTSNPSPAYVRRVASIFNNDGSGIRGNLQAVVKAILLDSEARSGDYPGTPAAAGGHLAEPVLLITRLLRALGAVVPKDNSLGVATSWLGQPLFFPPTVFNYFSPLYQLPGGGLFAPEFQIHSGSYAMNRASFVWHMLAGGSTPGYGVTIDLTPSINLAINPGMLLDSLNLLLHGAMSVNMRQSILNAINATTGQQWQAQNALFLAASSPRYQVIY